MRSLKQNRKQLSKILTLLGINMKNIEALRTASDLLSVEAEKEVEICARFKTPALHRRFGPAVRGLVRRVPSRSD